MPVKSKQKTKLIDLLTQYQQTYKQEGPEGPGSLTWGKGQRSQWIQ